MVWRRVAAQIVILTFLNVLLAGINGFQLLDPIRDQVDDIGDRPVHDVWVGSAGDQHAVMWRRRISAETI
jgi:hypothetical protein